MIPFGIKSVTLSMLIDLLTSTCRSTQVKIASIDLWHQEMFTFSEMLALVESESSFGAYVCHRRPGGSRATSDLVHFCTESVAVWRGAEAKDKTKIDKNQSRLENDWSGSFVLLYGWICLYIPLGDLSWNSLTEVMWHHHINGFSHSKIWKKTDKKTFP